MSCCGQGPVADFLGRVPFGGRQRGKAAAALQCQYGSLLPLRSTSGISDLVVAFELAVNFGSNETAALAARELVIGAAPLTAGNQQVSMHAPSLNLVEAGDGSLYWLMTILPVGVGWGVVVDRGRERRPLTAAQLTDIGYGLYGLLGRFSGYHLAAGTLPGLVLAEDVLPEVRGPDFVPFQTGFVWLPYAGQRPSTLTADP